jgi:hypothetical protein
MSILIECSYCNKVYNPKYINDEILCVKCDKGAIGREKLSYLIDKYTDYCNSISSFNIRCPNFPESISENIVKLFINNKENIKCLNSSVGDLEKIIKDKIYRIEVKCFSSTGPTSFGPQESWDEIYFVDSIYFKLNFYKIYRINLKNCDKKFQQIMVNKTETYGQHCLAKRRPRICFDKIKEQLKDDCVLVFEGKYEDLFKK